MSAFKDSLVDSSLMKYSNRPSTNYDRSNTNDLTKY